MITSTASCCSTKTWFSGRVGGQRMRWTTSKLTSLIYVIKLPCRNWKVRGKVFFFCFLSYHGFSDPLCSLVIIWSFFILYPSSPFFGGKGSRCLFVFFFFLHFFWCFKRFFFALLGRSFNHLAFYIIEFRYFTARSSISFIWTISRNCCWNVVRSFFLSGELLMSLNRRQEAADVYRGLISRNPENRNYYLQLEQSLNLSGEEEKLKLYEEMKEKWVCSWMGFRIAAN